MKLVVLSLTLAFLLSGCSPKEGTVANAKPTPTPLPGPGESAYSALNEQACKKLTPDAEEKGIVYKAECPGVAGYKVIHSASDHSSALAIVDPLGASLDTGIARAVNSAAGFTLGDKMEWRFGENGRVIAYIVRADKFIDPIDQNKRESVLLVGKLTAKIPCVTDIVGPEEEDQNARARELSSALIDRPCLGATPAPSPSKQK